MPHLAKTSRFVGDPLLLYTITLHCYKNLAASFYRSPAMALRLTASDSISPVFSSKKKNRARAARSQTPVSPRSYADKLSDKFKWPEEISIHLGPVSSQSAVGGWGPESSNRAEPSHDRCISNESVTVNSECSCVCLFWRISQCAFTLPGGRANNRVSVWLAETKTQKHQRQRRVLYREKKKKKKKAKNVDSVSVCLLYHR